MRLPSAASYMEALQDPSSCFADPELASAAPVLGPLGLPHAVSGNVATVFKVEASSGRSWAIRCFVRPVEDAQRRYDEIGAHLARLHATWRVGFDLQPRGIRVDGNWWPMLKMAWSPGRPLLSYIERELWNGPALAYLAVRLAAVADRLRADGVAHGDLQHGNILVAPGGDLRLVDYDGMYVPAMAGWRGTERGHRNYQHPGRAGAELGPHLDHFSSWVIYASLIGLSVNPLLWGRLDGGDECLLLRQQDLADPGRSLALAALESSEEPALCHLARLLRSFIDRDEAAVPPLSLAAAPPPPPHALHRVTRHRTAPDRPGHGQPTPDQPGPDRPAPDQPAPDQPAHDRGAGPGPAGASHGPRLGSPHQPSPRGGSRNRAGSQLFGKLLGWGR